MKNLDKLKTPAMLLGIALQAFLSVKYGWKFSGQSGYVYVMGDGIATKLGMSENPEQRVKEIARKAPGTTLHYQAKFNDMREGKSAINHYFKEHAIETHNGMYQWFDIEPNEAIEYLKASIPTINIIIS